MYRNFLAWRPKSCCNRPLTAVLMGRVTRPPRFIDGRNQYEFAGDLLPAGPMLRGNWNGQVLGNADVWKYWAKRAGQSAIANGRKWKTASRVRRVIMTMGTASTMTSIAETLGMTLPGASSIPAVDANHSRMASACGRRVVEMIWEDLKPSDILSPASFENAITADMAIGGSTNAIIHLVALAGRAGIKLNLKAFDDISQRTPMVANLRPSGQYLMEDFYYAGGLRALLKEIGELLNLDALTVSDRRWERTCIGA